MTPIDAIPSFRAPPVGVPAGASGGAGFAQALDWAHRAASPSDEHTARAREAAARFVGMAFIEPILASLRETSAAAGPFAPGEGERRFGPMLDSMLADRIAAAASFGIADAIAQRLGGRIAEVTRG